MKPTRIRLEASSLCQLRCPVCPTGQGKTRESVCGSGLLSFADFKRLLDHDTFVREVELSNWGEVFLNRELVAILEYAFLRDVKITISNGANLNHASDAVLEALVKTRVEEVCVALDGATAETYRKYRIRGNFDRVIANVKKINHFKESHGSKRPRLIWQFIVFGHNEHEIDAARRMARSLDMAFSPKLNVALDYSPVINDAMVREATGLREVNAGTDWGMPMCRQLWLSPQINWDGKVLGCCHNTWQDFGGNAFRDGLESSLASANIVYARRMLTGKAPSKDDVPCTRCEFYARMAAQRRWVNPRRVHAQMLAERLFPRWRQVHRSVRRALPAPLKKTL
jgi:MoaA/NifB/PqqE/SkfB family radical SAM enzyme